jgi:hypothetical protein
MCYLLCVMHTLLQVDLATGYKTQSMLVVPITAAASGRVLGVVQLINKIALGDIHGGKGPMYRIYHSRARSCIAYIPGACTVYVLS